MKTAISIPDNLFKDAEETARQLGLARSQLYVKAIKQFIELHNKEHITEQLNTVYSKEDVWEEVSNIGVDSLREASVNDSW